MVGQEPEEYRPRRAWVDDPDANGPGDNPSTPDHPSTPDDARSTDAATSTDADAAAKPAETKPTETKPTETKAAETKPTGKNRRGKKKPPANKTAASESSDSARPQIDDSLFRPGSAKAASTDDADPSSDAAGSDDDAETRLSPRVTAAGAPHSDDAPGSAKATGSKNTGSKNQRDRSEHESLADDETQIRPAVPASRSESKRPGSAKRPESTGALGASSQEDDNEATTLLPRTARAEHDGDHGADESRGSRLGPRSRLALLVGAVAAVVVLGLAVGYAVISLNGKGEVAGPGGPPTAAATDSSSAAPTEDSTVALNDASMLTSKDAKLIDSKRTWKVAETQKGKGDDSPQPACTTNDPVEGQPNAQQTFLRTLTASGSKPPAVLHQAEAFANVDEATQAFTLAAKALGGCAMDHAYVDSGVALSGLGNQSTGVVVNIKDKQSQFRTILLSRTGRVVNTVDVARDDKPVSASGVAKALGQVTNDQCTAAIGLCATNVKVADGPPPIGGDQPGFLAPADIPPVDGQDGVWSGDTPGEVKDLFSGCEGVKFSSAEGASKREARTYLLAENTDTPESFGLDQVLLSMKKDSDAKKLVKKVSENLSSCGERSLTASVEDAKDISGTGAKGAKITGSVTTVSQKVSSSNTAQYRVGILQAGNKVIYTFLPTTSDFDFTNQQWKDLNVRAGERATQVK